MELFGAQWEGSVSVELSLLLEAQKPANVKSYWCTTGGITQISI
jgi:hypothetical protein